MIRTFLRGYLPQLIGLALLVFAGFAGWQWLTSQGYKARLAANQVLLLEAHGELATCKANSISRLAQIQRQNAAVVAARAEGEARRQAALAARDGALAVLDDTQARYERLRRDWPQGCVAAVERIREEFGL